MTAQPGAVPGAQHAAGTMFAAIYGDQFSPDLSAKNDAYSLFHTRALAMGWETDGTPVSDHAVAPGLWGMNDAGWSHPRAQPDLPAPLAAWFQIDAAPITRNRPLPVQPFLRCAADTLTRAGTIQLRTVQLLLPMHLLATSARRPNAPLPSLETTYWFADSEPEERTSVTVNLNMGTDPTITARSEHVIEHIRRIDQATFRFVSYEPERAGQAVPTPLFTDDFWNGPPEHGLTIHGELAAWSFDAVGWLCEVLADCVSSTGTYDNTLLTVTQTAI